MDDDAAAAERDAQIAEVARAHGTDPEALLREVAAFRLALDADLTVAAAAATVRSVTSPATGDAPSAEQDAVHAFEERLLARVARDRSSVRSRVSAGRRRVASRRAAAVATATALTGLAGGAVFAAGTVGHRSGAATGRTSAATVATPVVEVTPSVARAQAQQLAAAVDEHRSPAAIAAAATALHASILAMLAPARSDPALADQLRLLLEQEQAALTSLDSSDPAIAAALVQAEQLLGQLRALDPTVARRLPTAVSSARSASPNRTSASPRTGTSPSATVTTGASSSGGATSSPSPTQLLPLPSVTPAPGSSSGLHLGP